MVLIRLKGGLGNQMFQYAFAKSVAKVLDTELKLDLTSLLDRSKKIEHFVFRNYDLDIFKINSEFELSPGLIRGLNKIPTSTTTKILREIARKNRPLIKETDFGFQAQLISNPNNNTIYEGWFQSYKYFENIESEVRQDFEFRDKIIGTSKALYNQIKENNSICLNVRRTDFLKVDNLNTTSLDYFLKAVNKMAELVEDPVFFIFSDDISWCRENLKLPYPSIIVDHQHKGNKFSNYLQLMKANKHFIIPNSSFAWWAAWLSENPDKRIIAPYLWFRNKSIDTSSLIPSDWIRL